MKERDLFLEIWEERQHVCCNCGVYLQEPPQAIYFSHIKSKGAHPKLKYDKNNIQLLCGECHFAHDMRGRKKYEERRNANNVSAPGEYF
jgi:5-methylcytosine-specific restriction endonuclease McrA